jgi:mannose-6-phosphate isomerase
VKPGAAPTAPRRLRAEFKEKIWGATRLTPWFPDTTVKTGEVWFTHPERAALPLLVKFLFTTEKLSVQVHPDDEFAARHESSLGKTEMWHILRAEPGASIALGLREPVSAERLREVSLSGEIESLLHWRPVSPGESFFIPPGTIHAIGAGLALCEVQQVSDVTYRLYDYGRPRELHLDKAIAVSHAVPHPGAEPQRLKPSGAELLAACRYFRVEKLRFTRPAPLDPTPAILTILEGSGTLAGQPYSPGESFFVEPPAAPLEIQPESPTTLLRASVPLPS